MDIEYDHTNFETQILFLGSRGPKNVYFLSLYKISDRLIGHMTYFIFESLSAQRIPNFFGLRTLSINL
jgi:hypothetical protein